MTKINEMINKAVEVLVINGMKKSNGHGLISGYQDLSVSNIEMLEFLTATCPETIETLDQECKKLIAEYPESVFSGDYSIIRTRVELDKKYHFGFMKRYPVDALDTISNISEILMKDRHVVYLNKLKEVKPNIDVMVIEGYNQTHKELNPFRMEQCFSYIYEELESEGIKISYPDYSKACLDVSISKPYFCKSNYGYYVVDNKFGGYSGSLYITDAEKGEKPQWYYGSSNGADRWHGHESTAITEVEKLRALNSLAGFEELDWEIIFANRHDVPLRTGYHSLYQDVPKGKIMIHKRLEREIRKPKLSISKRSA